MTREISELVFQNGRAERYGYVFELEAVDARQVRCSVRWAGGSYVSSTFYDASYVVAQCQKHVWGTAPCAQCEGTNLGEECPHCWGTCPNRKAVGYEGPSLDPAVWMIPDPPPDPQLSLF
jgi:hypothetical protein